MSVTLESKVRIDALISSINGKTGGSAADLTTAVQTLMDGFGQGGGGGASVQSGSFVPEQNINSHNVTLEKEATNFIVWKSTNALTYGVRTMVIAVKLADMPYVVVVNTNSAGTNPSANISTANNTISFNGNTVALAANWTSSYFVTEEYKWVAW